MKRDDYQYNQFDSFDAHWAEAYKDHGYEVKKEETGMRKWIYEAGLILFDDSKNDMRALPKAVRFQIMTVLSTMWSLIFTLVFWSYSYWGVVLTSSIIAHILVIIGVYYTFKSFMYAQKFTMRNDGYHTQTRSRQNLWVDGEKVELDPRDPGGEHE